MSASRFSRSQILTVTIAALLAGVSAHATIYQWDGGALTGDWQTAANWNPDALNPSFNGTGIHRLNVNGATALIYSANEGTTVYGNSNAGQGSGRGLVIGGGSMRITGGSFSARPSTSPTPEPTPL